MTEAPPTIIRGYSEVTPSKQRSRMTNGRVYPPGINGRTAMGRRYKDLYHAYRDACPLDTSSVTVDALLRSLASTTVRLEERGSTAPTDDYAAMLNAQLKLMDRLGLSPKPDDPPADDPLTLHRRRMGWDQ